METVIRVVLIYLVILIGLRILGKREFGQLSPLELITLLLIPEIASQALLRNDFSLTNAVIALTTLFSLVFLTSIIRYLNSGVERAISGEPRVLVSHGQFIEHNMHRERVDADEIYGEMHKAGLDRIEEVRWAILGTDGKIAIVSENPSSEMAHEQAQEDIQIS